MYYPWVRVVDPLTRQEIALPPSGFVAGIYARNDINRAVWKAPANEVVNLAIGFEPTLNKSQQDVLNPEGINCFRYFDGRGYRLWGARTVSSTYRSPTLPARATPLPRSRIFAPVCDRGGTFICTAPDGVGTEIDAPL
jgi:hypothetical protein